MCVALTNDLSDIIIELAGIWKYASLDLHEKNGGKKTPQEYELTLIKMWDYLDKLDLKAIEGVIVELEGKCMGDCETIDKILKSQLDDYLAVRVEQDVGYNTVRTKYQASVNDTFDIPQARRE